MESQSEPESQRFIPQSDDDKNVFPALAITAEKGKKFKVRWAGTDPATNKPWPESWEPKSNVMSPLVRDWKARKQAKKDRKKSSSTRSKASSSTRSRRSTTVKVEDEDDYQHPASRKTATMAWQRTKLEDERTPSTSRSTSTSRLRKRISKTRQSPVAEKLERDDFPSPDLRMSVIFSPKAPTKSRSVSISLHSAHSDSHEHSHHQEMVLDDLPPQSPEPEIVPRKRKRELNSSPEAPTQESITPEARQRKKRKTDKIQKSKRLVSLSEDEEDVDMHDNASLLSNTVAFRSESRSGLDLVDATGAALEEVEPDLEIVQDSLENAEDSQERREPSPLPPIRTTSKTPRPVPFVSHIRHLHPLEEPDLNMLSSADRARLRRHDRDLAVIEEAHRLERTSSAVVTVQSALPANDQGMVVLDSQETRPKRRMREPTRSPSPRPLSRRSLMKGKSPSKVSVGRSPSIKSMGSVNSFGKVLAPIPVISQSTFRPYLTPKVDDDAIEEFSSPIKPPRPQERDEDDEEEDVPEEEPEAAEAPPEEEDQVLISDPVPYESRDSQYYQRKGEQLAEEARRKAKGEPVRKRRLEEFLKQKREKAEESHASEDKTPPPSPGSDTDDDQSHLIHYDARESQQDEPPVVEMHPVTDPESEPEPHPPSEPDPLPEPAPERESTPEQEPQPEPAPQPEPDSQETNDNTRTDIDDSGELRQELNLEEKVKRRREEEESTQDLEDEERARKGTEPEQTQNQPEVALQQPQDTGIDEPQQFQDMELQYPEDVEMVEQQPEHQVAEQQPEPQDQEIEEPSTDDAARTIRLLNAATDDLRNQLAEQAKQATFLQAQYTAASAYVDDVRKDNAKLTETNATLQSQVTSGMALIRSTYDGRVKWLEQNATRWQETAQFIMKKDALTNDDVRKKASLLPVREAELQNMRAEMVGWRGRAEAAERRCRELEGRMRDLEQQRESEQQPRESEQQRREVAITLPHRSHVAPIQGNFYCNWRPCKAGFGTRDELEVHFGVHADSPGVG